MQKSSDVLLLILLFIINEQQSICVFMVRKQRHIFMDFLWRLLTMFFVLSHFFFFFAFDSNSFFWANYSWVKSGIDFLASFKKKGEKICPLK